MRWSDAGALFVTRNGTVLKPRARASPGLVVAICAWLGIVSRTAARLARRRSAQVGEDDHVVLGQDGCDVVPHDVGLGSVQQQDGVPVSLQRQGVDLTPPGARDSIEQVAGSGTFIRTLLPVR